MKVVVFGTGLFYKNRKERVWKQKVVAFLDNDPQKQGTSLDNRMIYSPDKIKDLDYDYVLLMGKDENCRAMKQQLVELGIDEDSILRFDEFCDYEEQREIQLYYSRGSSGVFGDASRRIVLLSHELSNTGAPIVLLNAAMIMKKNGYNPVIVSPKDGPLRAEIIEHDIPVMIEKHIRKKNEFIWEWMTSSAFVWVNTLDFSYLIDDLAESGVPAAWWLHETDISYEIIGMSKMPKGSKIIPTYGVGKCAIASFEKYLKRNDIRNLFYGIPDERKEKKICFALIGTISVRKGQDIFADAVALLSEEQRAKAEFKVIGGVVEQHVYDALVLKAKDYPCLEVVGPVSHEEMLRMYKTIDVVVCPSRMDPMPVVITEGLMNHKICIASNATGSSGLITDGKDGFVCEVNAESLAEKMAWIIEHEEELDGMKEAARKLYEDNFSMDVFEKNIMQILKKRDKQ